MVIQHQKYVIIVSIPTRLLESTEIALKDGMVIWCFTWFNYLASGFILRRNSPSDIFSNRGQVHDFTLLPRPTRSS